MTQIKMLCFCRGEIYVTEEDFGGEVECGRCGSDVCVPETEEAITQANFEVTKDHEEMRYTGRHRVMIIDECGTEQCIIDDATEGHLEWIVKGVRADYPEARDVFTEPVENDRYMAEQFMLDDDFNF